MVTSEFYKEWFLNHNWWFNATKEDDKYISEKFGHLLDNTDGLTLIEKVIVYDQLPRHIFRNTLSHHIIEYFLTKALEICDDIVPINEYEYMFSKLPLRHTNEPIIIHDVMYDIWKQEEYLKLPIFRKFIKATYERCPKEQSNFVEIIESKISKLKIIPISEYDEVFVKFRKHIKQLGLTKLILSFSGGVDSMICSVMLSNIPEITWSAVHINYTNRENHLEEEKFVIDWCNYLGVKLFIRRIDEINREPCMENELRELYENYTRNVRYNTYKCIGENIPILLGHNSDDCIENILTNIAQQQKYEQLTGMSLYCVQDDIQFIRPLLDTTKSEIYDFANRYAIKHLPNSTPSWSQRGQIRDKVLPVLEQWDSRITTGLFKLNDNLSDLHKCMELLVCNMIANTESNELILNDIPEIVLLWRMYIQKRYNITASCKSIENFISMFKKIKNIQTIPITKNLNVRIDTRHGYYSLIWTKTL